MHLRLLVRAEEVCGVAAEVYGVEVVFVADMGGRGDSSCPDSAGGIAGEEGAAASFRSVAGGRRVLCGRRLQAAGSTSVIWRGRCSGRFVGAGRCCC